MSERQVQMNRCVPMFNISIQQCVFYYYFFQQVKCILTNNYIIIFRYLPFDFHGNPKNFHHGFQGGESADIGTSRRSEENNLVSEENYESGSTEKVEERIVLNFQKDATEECKNSELPEIASEEDNLINSVNHASEQQKEKDIAATTTSIDQVCSYVEIPLSKMNIFYTYRI